MIPNKLLPNLFKPHLILLLYAPLEAKARSSPSAQPEVTSHASEIAGCKVPIKIHKNANLKDKSAPQG